MTDETNDTATPIAETTAGTQQSTASAWGFGSILGNIQKQLPELQKKLETDLNKTKQKLQELKLDDEVQKVSKNTDKYLDDLDSHLEKVENVTLGYASKFSSFLKSKTGIDLELVSDADAATTEQDSEVLFNLPHGIAGTRVEAQMRELQSNKKPYLEKHTKDPKAYDEYELTEAETKEKESLLAAKGEIYKIHEEIVPSEVDDDFFWKYYFDTKDSIVAEEQKRKELLKKATDVEDEDFDWDDSESEGEGEEEAQPETKAETKAETGAVTKAEPETELDTKPETKPAKPTESAEPVKESELKPALKSTSTKSPA